MKKIFLLFTLFFLLGISLSKAQLRKEKSAVLSVLSENEPFVLYVDNVPYNQTPTNAIRIEEIYKRSVTIRLEMSRRGRRVATEKVVDLYSENGYFLNVSYNVSKEGTAKLILWSLFPAGDFAHPNFDDVGAYVYGKPNQLIFSHRQPGYDFITYSDKDFADFIKSLKNQSFDSDKLKFLDAMSPDIHLSVSQIEAIMKQFSFDDGKLSVAKKCYNICFDTQNYHKLTAIFSFSSSRNNLIDYIAKSNRR